MKCISLFLIVLFIACGQQKKEKVQPIDTSSLMDQQQQPLQVKVEEVLQTSSYTYLRVAENGKNFWMAVAKIDAKVGDNFYYEKGLEMKDFKSKELDRVFEQVFFVNKISQLPLNEMPVKRSKADHAKTKTPISKADVNIVLPEGGITIAELYGNSEAYASKKVLVRGKVVKVNKAIMGKNWIHLQDGTSHDGNFDLTLTTQELAKVGDELSFEGTVSLKKDFGAGYFYELIIEEAKLK